MKLKNNVTKILLAILIMLLFNGCTNSFAKNDYDFYIFNSDSNISNQLSELALAYEQETGINIKVNTVDSGQNYTQELNSELKKRNKPTIFTVETFEQVAELSHRDNILNLSNVNNTKFKIFMDSIPANLKLNISNDSSSYGVPYGIEAYGLVVDKQMIDDLFEEDAENIIQDMIKSNYYEFENLVLSINEYINSGLRNDISLNNKYYTLKDSKVGLAKELVDVFTVLDNNMSTHINNIANVAVNTVYDTKLSAFDTIELDVKQLHQPLRAFAKTLDLITNNMSSSMDNITRLDNSEYDYLSSLKVFSQGKALFLLQGTWAYNDLKELNYEQSQRLEFIPIKIVLEQDDIYVDKTVLNFKSSIPVFVNSYYAINSKSSKNEQELAMDFLIWLNKSETGRNFIINNFSFIPYDIELTDSIPNTLGNSAISYMNRDNTLSASFLGMPQNVLQNLNDTLKTDYLPNKLWTAKDYTDIAELIINTWNLTLQ